ncbi:MAG: FG-GAP-like repeat-containing protein [Bacteroidota bacterium]
MKKLSYFLLTFLTCGAAFGQINFTEHQIEYGDVYQPRDVFSADVDNDGDIDILTAAGHDKVAWYENLGGGQFSFQKIISNHADDVYDVHAADLDGDGDLDALSASWADDKIAWYENLGNGYFSSEFIVDATLNGAVTVEVMDVDNDGKPDIVAGAVIGDEVVWYRNLGNGNFAPKVTIISINAPRDIKLADFDGDGLLDILTFREDHYNVTWFKNSGSATFATQGSLTSSSSNTIETVITDADGDGDWDVAISNSTNFKLYKNDGSGNFGFGTVIYSNHPFEGLDSEDMDNDGDLDIAFAESPGAMYELGWFDNDGTGDYTWRVAASTWDWVLDVNAEDYDNDGNIDLSVASSMDNRINWFRNLGNNTFSNWITISSNLQDIIYDVEYSDLDGDGDLDVIAANSESVGSNHRVDDQRIVWYENLGDGNYGRHKVICYKDVLENPSQLRAADMDGDGDNDVVALSSYVDQLTWFENDGSGNFTYDDMNTINSFSDEINSFDIGDLDGDGDLDVVVNKKDFAESLVIWYENLGNGNFNFGSSSYDIDLDQATIGLSARLKVVDMDQDGQMDVLSSMEYSNQLWWYKNLGNNVFSTPNMINPSISGVQSAEVSDLDNDGDLDVVALSKWDNKLVWHKNNGSNLFAAEAVIDATLVLPKNVRAADLTGDGLDDIYVVHDKEMILYPNTGNGTFAERQLILPLTDGSVTEEIADINGDGKEDILFGEAFQAKVSWLENHGTNCANQVVILNDTVCEGSSYAFNGMNIYEEGTYVDTLLSAGWCDSVVILNLRHKIQGCVIANCNELYISEYMRGSSFNKAIEIYNPTSDNIDLGVYSIQMYVNGSQTPTNTIPLSGTIFSDSTFIISHSSAAAAILNVADIQTAVLNYTGNDAVTLVKNGEIIDMIGQIGVDPGTAWTDGGASTSGMTLVRKYSETMGHTTNFSYSVSTYFDPLPLDDFSSLTLHSSACQPLLCNTDSMMTARICEGDSYNFFGNMLTETGVYTETLTNAANCDSVVTLDLSVNSSNKFLVQTICNGDSYAFNGQNVSTAGIYLDTLPNMYGCDSVIKLTLHVYPPVTGVINQTICQGDSIVVNGTSYKTSVTGAIEIFPGAGFEHGCDSTVIINLVVLPIPTGIDVREACNSYTWIDGLTYTSSNNAATYLIANGAASGCDSLAVLDLTIHTPSFGVDTRTECTSYTWIDGITYTSDNNTATHTIVGGNSNGCDSTVTLNLTIIQPGLSVDVQTGCGSYIWMDGVTYFSDNSTATYTIPGGAANGCDSIITLNLTILPLGTGTDTQVDCGPFTWIDGNTYTTSNNTAVFVLPGGSVNGCDSIVELDLTIIPASHGTDVQAACESYTWIDGNTYTSSNSTATFTIPNGSVTGCDSIVHLDLTIQDVNATISVFNTTLTCDVSGGTYIWLDCGDNTQINGAVSQSFTPTFNGEYAVIVTKNNCTDTSVCVAVNNAGTMDLELSGPLSLYPNPASDWVTVQFGELTDVSIRIYDHSGKEVYRADKLDAASHQVSTQFFARGVYIVHVRNGSVSKNLELIKM